MRVSGKVAVAVALLVAAAAAAGWWYTAAGPDLVLQQGQAALQQGERARALALARQLAADGYADHANLLRGAALVQAAQYAEALQVFNRIRDQGALRRQAAALSGQCLLQLGELLQAERAFAFVLSEQPDEPLAQRGLAAVYFDLAAFPLAVRHARKWAELEPADGRPWRWIGLIHKDLGQHAEAGAAYQEALQRRLTPQVRDEVRLELAECLLKQADFHAALAALSPAPPLARVLTLRAEAEHGLGQTSRAAELVAQALAADPADATALRLRGQLRLETGALDPALADLEQAVRLAPHEYPGHYLLAQAYARAGRVAEAQEQQRQVKEIQGALDELTKLAKAVMASPKEAPLHARMAELYQQLGMSGPAERSRRVAALLAAPAQRPETVP